MTPPPAARPLPVGFSRTPPKVIRVAAKLVGGEADIIVQLDQGIVAKLAMNEAWYGVEMPVSNGSLGSNGEIGVAVSRVAYEARTHTITLVVPRRPKVQGNVVLTVDADGIVNLLGQELEGDNLNPGVNLVREVDLP